MARKRRRRVRGPGAAFAGLAMQDRFVLRFYHRYQVLIPKGLQIRSDAQLAGIIADFGGARELAAIFADDQIGPKEKARRREIEAWRKRGYDPATPGPASPETAITDPITTDQVQHPIDAIAIRRGCRYDPARAHFATEWMESNLVLYEGECAGDPFECRDWQDVVSRRLFGWVRWSKKWQRWVRRFRWLICFVAKKNKKSPTLAAYASYLAFGDGEPGMHLYLCAKDGKQAKKIAGTHAIEMVRQSPELSMECKINLNDGEILHKPTKSTILPLSSSNERTTKSKEGLNGSYLVDESHVVDWTYVDRIKRMGISRPEPIGGDLSTAGTDPDSYGKDRFDYGISVNKAEVEDILTCAAIYAMPQDMTAAKFARAPVKYAKLANPALGHTVDIEELRNDFEASRRSIIELRKFFMYRGNVWGLGASPWLNHEAWLACAREIPDRELAGKVCGGAWDLMRSKDMAALALAFPEDTGAADLKARSETPHTLWVRLWMTEAAIELYSAKVRQLPEWVNQGWLHVHKGATINYESMETETAEQLALVDCQRFHYDPMFATASIQRLTDTHGFPADRIAEFKQSRSFYSYPIAIFEKLILEGKLHHQGNACLNWQAGHVCCKDFDGKRTLCRAEGETNDHQKYDGIAASVMALDAALRREVKENVYNKRGFIALG